MPHPALAFPLTAITMNGLIYGLGWNRGSSQNIRNPLLPPGYVIATIWIVLFALMGSQYSQHPSGSTLRTAILVYAGYCLAYPLLTSGLQMGARADLLNMGALVGALGLMSYIFLKTHRVPWLLTPLLAWTLFVNAAGYFQPPE